MGFEEAMSLFFFFFYDMFHVIVEFWNVTQVEMSKFIVKHRFYKNKLILLPKKFRWLP